MYWFLNKYAQGFVGDFPSSCLGEKKTFIDVLIHQAKRKVILSYPLNYKNDQIRKLKMPSLWPKEMFLEAVQSLEVEWAYLSSIH